MLLLRMHGTRCVVPESRYQSHFFCLRVSLISNVCVIAYFSMVNPPMEFQHASASNVGQIGCTSLESNQLFDCIVLIRSNF